MKFSSLIMTTGLSVAAAGMFTVAPLAQAKEQPVVVTAPLVSDEVPVRYVRYSDLQLETRHGQSMLNRRVTYAVRGVCAESVLLPNRLEERNCHKVAWNGARPQMDRAIQRATEIAQTGKSSIAAAAITINVPAS